MYVWRVSLVVTLCLVSTALAQNVAKQTLTGKTECEAKGLRDCGACENDEFKCYECLYGYALKADLSGCISCGLNCRECLLDSNDVVTTCTECEPRFANKTGVCTACGTGCDECFADTADNNNIKCTSCLPGYVLNYLGVCKLCSSVSACIDCAPSNATVDVATGVTCIECAPGFFKDGISCKSCNVAGCKSCSAVGSCSSCMTGYELDTTGQGSCPACQTWCADGECLSGKTINTGGGQQVAPCGKCKDNYYLDNKQECQSCSGSCKTCVDASDCSVCHSGTFLSNKFCSSCPFQCAVCPNNTACTTCNDRFILKDSGENTCDRCIANCDTCSLTQASAGQCGTCAVKFYRDANKECKSCPNNCDDCTSGTLCKTNGCSSGYTFNSDTLTCDKCPNDCVTCGYNVGTFMTECLSCPATYFILEGRFCYPSLGCPVATFNSTSGHVECECTSGITPDVTTVQASQFRGVCLSGTVCDAGFYFDEINLNCTACAQGCTYCNDTFCIDCEPGYRMDSSTETCVPCTTLNCATCITTNSNTELCDSCDAGFLDLTGSSGVCSPCGVSNCAICPTQSTCGLCKTNYRTSGALCVSTVCSVAECATCAVNASICQTCNDGFTLLSDNTCAACPTGCRTCAVVVVNNVNTIRCTACFNTNYVINTETCAYCGPHCASCSQANGAVTCSVCDKGWAVDTDGTCKQCPANCLECTIASCSVCAVGYGVSADTASCTSCSSLTTVTSCSTCTDASAGGKCTSCSGSKILAQDQSYCWDSINFCYEPMDRDWDCTLCEGTDRVLGTEELMGRCIYECYSCGMDEFGVVFGNYSECHVQNDEDDDVIECEQQCAIRTLKVGSEWTFAGKGCGGAGNSTGPEYYNCVGNNDGDNADCTRFCTGNNCNGGLVEDGAPRLCAGVMLLVSTLLLACLA